MCEARGVESSPSTKPMAWSTTSTLSGCVGSIEIAKGEHFIPLAVGTRIHAAIMGVDDTTRV